MSQSTKTKIAILTMSGVVMSPSALSVILAKVRELFPAASLSGVQMVLTLSTLASLTAILLSGKIIYYMTKKNMVLTALLMMSLGGLFALSFHEQLSTLYIAAIVIGLGQGIVMTLSTALIADYFENGERSSLMGKQSGILSIGGTMILLCAGWLSSINWYYVYFVYLITIPVLLVVYFLLPKGEKAKKADVAAIKIFNPTLLYYCLLIFFFSVCQYTYSTNVALLLKHTGLGTQALTGVATACFSTASFVSGMMMGRIYKRLKTYTITVGLASIAGGLLLCSWAPSLLVVFLGGAMVGMGVGASIPTGIIASASSVPPAGSTIAIALFTASSSFGLFCSPIIVNNVTALTGSTTESARYLTAACFAVVLISVTLVRELRNRRFRKNIKSADGNHSQKNTEHPMISETAVQPE